MERGAPLAVVNGRFYVGNLSDIPKNSIFCSSCGCSLPSIYSQHVKNCDIACAQAKGLPLNDDVCNQEAKAIFVRKIKESQARADKKEAKQAAAQAAEQAELRKVKKEETRVRKYEKKIANLEGQVVTLEGCFRGLLMKELLDPTKGMLNWLQHEIQASLLDIESQDAAKKRGRKRRR